MFSSIFGLARLSETHARGLIYLQMSISGLATVFVTRTQGFSWVVWKERPGIPIVIAFCAAQLIAMFLGAYGLGGFPWDRETHF